MSENFPHQAEMEEPYEDGNSPTLVIVYYLIRAIELVWSPIRWIKKSRTPIQIRLAIVVFAITAVAIFGVLTVLTWLGVAVGWYSLRNFWQRSEDKPQAIYEPMSLFWILIMFGGVALSVIAHTASN